MTRKYESEPIPEVDWLYAQVKAHHKRIRQLLAKAYPIGTEVIVNYGQGKTAKGVITGYAVSKACCTVEVNGRHPNSWSVAPKDLAIYQKRRP